MAGGRREGEESCSTGELVQGRKAERARWSRRKRIEGGHSPPVLISFHAQILYPDPGPGPHPGHSLCATTTRRSRPTSLSKLALADVLGVYTPSHTHTHKR